MLPSGNLVDFNRGYNQQLVNGRRAETYRHGVIYHDFLLNFLKYTLVFLVVAFYPLTCWGAIPSCTVHEHRTKLYAGHNRACK